jgi:signal transduction histidine kinase
MKLLNKTGLYYFILSLLIMAAGALAYYFVILRYADADATEKLYIERLRIKQKLAAIDSIPSGIWIFNNDIRYDRIQLSDSVHESLRDTIIHEPYDSEDVPYRMLRFRADTRRYAYHITVLQSLVESEDLIGSIVKDLFILLLIYLLCLILINYVISARAWRPFYDTLERLRGFDIMRGDVLQAQPTDIYEFSTLNAALEHMTQKMQSDYRTLKEFTENASHEIQTPLAIIRAKVELMLQADDLSHAQWEQLASINDAAERLSRLNQALLLLSKIENGQFQQTESINLSQVLSRQLEHFDELITARQVKLHVNIEPGVMVRTHPYLLDILLSNLLMNAIRHNLENGFINLHLDQHTLTIDNAGPAPASTTEELFGRFKKGNASGESIGIGLSIARKIAESNNMKIAYTYHDLVHYIRLDF